MVELLFIIGFVGTIITLPLQDILSLGFVDITDLLLGLVATACVSLIFGNPETETKLTLGLIYAVVIIVFIILKIVVILPFRYKSENSTTFSMKSIAGKQGTVTTTITKESMGEVMVYAGFTRINKGARIYNESTNGTVIEKIPIGADILVIEVKDNILYVIPYENSIKATKAKSSWNSI